ncbi:gliding motility-associated C-terminal domain-containing protein [Christiangramia gaetbulicola]|uniref:gliding motility-associated C-terminal domain-containing protein n=1 Tax=Christiangramia gaetbulicola TaxID=703340 RepID=UPI0014750C7D|nr:gliding motility-associated C-terminal domain-containing protein [Christiangramia gaetbulicola]
MGSASSYGQCYTVNDEDGTTSENEQTYCYLDSVQDLINEGVTDNDGDTAIFESADTVNDTDPIDENELLTNGETYYVGSTSDDSCERVAVEVTVNSADTPTNTVTNSTDGFTVTPCESSNFSGDDLLGLFETAPAGYSLEIYSDQFGDSEISDYSADLTDGNSYFVGFAPNDPTTDCPSERVAVGIDVVDAPAPTAASPQTFCEGATVGDLMASSEEENFQAFRWYRSATSSTPLTDDVALIDGEDYFVSQIVNERNSIFPPCESDRTQVIVEVISFDAGADVNGEICEDDLRQRIANGEGADILLSFITDGRTLPETVSFNPTLSALAQQFQNDPTQPIVTEATFTTPEECSDSFIFNITISESSNAGEDGTVILNSTDDTVNLFDYLNGTPDTGGTWNPGDGTFNPATDTPGDFIYTVENGSCSDSSIVNVIVTDCDPAPPSNSLTICNDDLDERVDDIGDVAPLYLSLLPEETPRDGSFNPTISSILRSYGVNNFQDFTTIYSYSIDDCDYSVELTITVTRPDPANAGNFDSIEDVCTNDDLIDLTAIANNNPDASTEGTFTGPGVTDNEFDPSIGAGEYTITYIVDDSLPCVVGNSETTFIISVEESLVATSIDRTLCVTEARELISNPIEGQAFLNSLLNEAGIETVNPENFGPDTLNEANRLSNFINNPTSDSEIFNFSYENESVVRCDNLIIDINITINNTTDAEAGEIGPKIVCVGDDSIDLNGYLSGTGASTGGTFTGTGVNENSFDPSIGTGTYTITYSVDDSADCTTPGTSDSTTFDITVTEGRDLGDDITVTFCETELDDTLTATQIGNYFASLIGAGYSSAGTFNPSIETLRDQYNSDNTQTFSTVYSIGEGDCADSITITAIVQDETAADAGSIQDQTVCSTSGMIDLNDFLDSSSTTGGTFSGTGVSGGMFDSSIGSNQDGYVITYTVDGSSDCTTDGTTDSTTFTIIVNDPQPANAGEIEDQTVCSNSGMIDLSDYLGETASTGGVFSGTGVADGMFDSSLGSNESGYEITYSVDDSADCVIEGTTDSTTFIISVQDSFSIGEDQSRDICQVQVDELFPRNSDVRAFYDSLLDPEVVGEGAYNPSIQSLINRYNSGDEIGAFTTVYTVTRDECSASVELTINVVDSIPAAIGDIADQTYCRNAEDVTLVDLLPEDANPNGTFEGYADGVFSPVMEGVGTFDITYTLTDDSPCTDGEASATFTITVTESAFAGMDMDLSVCMDAGVQNLFDFLSTDADTTGEFTLDGDVIADGMMDPANFAAGTYEVIYTVPEINDCGDDTAIFNITVEEAPGAPTVEGNPFTFCAIDGATVADLSATGTNLTFYSDADLTTMVMAEDALETGSYYVTQRNDEGACESAAAEITVTINDAATPTISNSTQEFCEFDDATVADLTDAVNETGNITWYDTADGDNALPEGTPLQDGTVYYATLFDVDSGCESSVRLAVTVSIDDDCPITIPEAFSPNGDGLNDTFEIRNIRDKYPNFTMKIRNRFGDLVFQGNANTPDWDGFSSEGSFGSGVLPVGAYFYYLDYNDGSTEPVRGTVYLSR